MNTAPTIHPTEPALSDAFCAPGALGRQLGMAWARLDAFDTLRLEEERIEEAGKREGKLPGDIAAWPHCPEAAWFDLSDRIDALRASLAAHPAQSLAGCLVQIAEARSRVEYLMDSIPGHDPEDKAHQRAIDRLLYSVVRHLETVAGTTLAEAGHEPVMPSRLDPWGAVEGKLAELRQARAEREEA